MKLIDHGQTRWMVVSYSLRDDSTWDVIYEAKSLAGASAYLDDVEARNRALMDL